MRHQHQHQLIITTAIAAIICGCVYPSYDGDEAALEEQHSVWQYLKVYSIYHDRLPNTSGPGSMTPYDMFDCIHDTLRGARYTEYVGYSGGRKMFDSNTKFHYPQPLTADSSTMYFRLPEFSDTALEYFNISLRELSRHPNLIIDVRDNGGGLLSVTEAILSELLPDSTPYINTRYREYNRNKYAGETLEEVSSTAKKYPELLKKKIAVLMNGYSASASEILAAGLKDAAGAYLVGSKSYGKGIGQFIIPRDEPNRERKQLSITYKEIWGLTERTGKYHRVGIDPDQVPREIFNEAVAQWGAGAGSLYVRELYYALKMLDSSVTLNPELAAKLRDVTTTVYGGAGAAKAAWRPVGAVIVNEKDLPWMRLSDE